jgi:molybdopterin synthase sulfur carrier subunit
VIDLIKVRVETFANIREILKKKEVELMIGDYSSVWNLLTQLCDSYPRLRRVIFEDDKLSDHVIILKNGRNIRWLDGLRTKLGDEDEIAMFPPVGGG